MGKKLSQFFCRGTRGTVSEHVTRNELFFQHVSLRSLPFPVPPAANNAWHPDVSFFRHLFLWKNALATSASVCRTIGRSSPIPQNSKLYCISLASFKTSLMLMISLSPLLSSSCGCAVGNHQPSNKHQMLTSCPDRKSSLHRGKPQ